MNAIEAYIQFEPGLITDEGEVTVESTREFLRNYMTELQGFITRVYMALSRGAHEGQRAVSSGRTRDGRRTAPAVAMTLLHGR